MDIAIVEDDISAAKLLKSFLERYGKEHGETFNITYYDNAVSFLTNYKPVFNIVFMDIEMPDLNGMDAAFRLREIDKVVTLVFVTNMAQYAVKGYEVQAFYFIVKPVTYYNFELKLRRAIEHANLSQERVIAISTPGGMARVKLSGIKYVEIMDHDLLYHTGEGDIRAYGTLKDAESLIADGNFVRCNSCYLVNLRYVTGIKGFTAVVGGDELKISHPKRKEFIKALNDYLGGGR